MPNHISNRVRIYGPQDVVAGVAMRFRHYDWEKEETVPVSFEGIIPMPKILQAEDQPFSAEEGYFALTGNPYPGGFGGKNPLGYPKYRELGITTPEELLEYLSKENPAAIAAGARAMRALKETGYPSWYEWRLDNWGTKWDAYDTSIDVHPECTTIKFDTAWNPPHPVIEQLARHLPDNVMMTHDYFDEGHGFWGTHIYEAKQPSRRRMSLTEDYRSLCIELRGYDPDNPGEIPKQLRCHVSLHLKKRLPPSHEYHQRYTKLLGELDKTAKDKYAALFATLQ